MPGNSGTACCCASFRTVLKPESLNLGRCRSEKRELLGSTCRDKISILAKEPVSGVHCISGGLQRDCEQLILIQIGLTSRAGTEEYASSAWRTCRDSRSASAYTATERIPSFFKVRMMRTAMAPRFAISTLLIFCEKLTSLCLMRSRSKLR